LAKGFRTVDNKASSKTALWRTDTVITKEEILKTLAMDKPELQKRFKVSKMPSSSFGNGFGLQRARQAAVKAALVAWPLLTLRSLLRCIALWAYFFLLPIACEGQGNEVPFSGSNPCSSALICV